MEENIQLTTVRRARGFDSTLPGFHGSGSPRVVRRQPVDVAGLPLLPVTLDEAVREVDRLIEIGTPSFIITANLNYAMLASRDPQLRAATRQAAFVVGDGAPLVWAAQREGKPLPERVAGSDLVPALCRLAARRNHRVFFLGGNARTAQAAARRVQLEHPSLRIVGVESPWVESHDEPIGAGLLARIREARPNLLFASISQPKGELWLARNCDRLGVPVSIQVGATFAFLAGEIPRAPDWMQRSGLEWFHRLLQEPTRLAGRYGHNALFLVRTLASDLVRHETSL